MTDAPIYFDANASSRLRPEIERVVAELVSPAAPKNPSSVHSSGRLARARLQAARKSVLRLLNGGPDGISQRLVFTSGGTESCNQMILGFLGPLPQLGMAPGKVVTSAIEHPAVLEPLSLLERCGWKIIRVRPQRNGIINVDEFVHHVDSGTALASLMCANNETGAIQPVREVATQLRAKGFGGAIVSDCIQAPGKMSFALAELFAAGVNAVSISGHKLGAPSGIGALVINTASSSVCHPYEPLMRGGAQEQGFRAGTENLLGAIALGAVADAINRDLESSLKIRRELRELLWHQLSAGGSEVERITPVDSEDHIRSLSNTLAVRFEGCRADDLVVALDIEGVAASTGSACSSGKQAISHVISSMGLDDRRAREVIRLSLDWDADAASVTRGAETILAAVNRMRSCKPIVGAASAA
ncbi:MAG: aminotransferase class V-fold PLP-dependent enzyme [Bdellovibrionota bacterium]